MRDNILLVGAGNMAIEYAKVLKAMRLPFIVVGRGNVSADLFKNSTGHDVVVGGIERWLKSTKTVPKTAIVAVSLIELGSVAKRLINSGVHSILVEKPGGLTALEVKSVARAASLKGVEVFVAYNRRFYASTRKAMEIIHRDGGSRSFIFEFTEWSHLIAKAKKHQEIKENWFLVNSTHVVDLAFFLGGQPKRISCYGAGSLKWHPAGSIFCGAGITLSGALFSYSANWISPGRWSLEMLTPKSRLIFRPLEKLQLQKIGSIIAEDVRIDYRLDQEFKPGLYRQVKSFLSDKHDLLSINQQVENLKYFYEIIKANRHK